MHSMLTTFLLAGSALALPSPLLAQRGTCTEDSHDIKEWNMVDFDFHATYLWETPSKRKSNGYVNFGLENPILGSRSTCKAQSGQLEDFFYGVVKYECEADSKDGTEGDKTTFTFSRPSGELHINQTWECPGENSRFEAKGGTKLDLKCEDKEWTNPDWQEGELYASRHIKCDLLTIPVPIDEVTGIA